MFILTIDCTSKSTNEYNNLKNDKIIKLENDSSNNSNTQQKTTTNEVKNQILYEFKQPVQESKAINMTTWKPMLYFMMV